jgi:hypothetical protein
MVPVEEYLFIASIRGAKGMVPDGHSYGDAGTATDTMMAGGPLPA